MDSISDRFRAIARYKGLSITEFEVATGLANGLVGKTKNPSLETVLKVMKRFPDISAHWLLSGEGEMVGESIIPIATEEKPTEEERGVPFLDGERIVAGPPSGYGMDLETTGYVNFPGLNKDMGEFAVRAKGRSMVDHEHPERSIPDGAIVLLSTRFGLNIEWGETFCVATRDGYVIKRLLQGHDENHIKCVSNNEKEGYLPYEIHMDDIIGLTRVTAVISIKTL